MKGIVTYIQNNSRNIHTTGELLLQIHFITDYPKYLQTNSDPTSQVVDPKYYVELPPFQRVLRDPPFQRVPRLPTF